MLIHIINGPNLNLLGKREPELYGSVSFEEYFDQLRKRYHHVELEFFQSNVEGLLIDQSHRVGFLADGLLINAGGYTHSSVALGDALSAVPAPAVEVHLTHTLAREDFRHRSLIARSCVGAVMGFGLDSYRLGLEALLERLGQRS